MNVEQLPVLAALAWIAGVLALGAYVTRVIGGLVADRVAGWGTSLTRSLVAPVHGVRRLATQQVVRTERPDAIGWIVAPAAYLGLAAAALTVVPFTPGLVVADVRTGIVVFGAAEALAIVAIFLHGWSPNSALPLVTAYRFVAVALSYELLSMFVLIAAAIPAESLSIGAVVDAQHGLWNVVRQPLGLPLWLVVGWGVTFSGPLAVADSAALASGGSAEDSGVQRLAWAVARAAMTTVFAVAGAAVFLGGWHGPVLPGAVWMAVKTLLVLALLVGGGAVLPRVPAERFVPVAWTILLPLAFADLLVAGVVAL